MAVSELSCGFGVAVVEKKLAQKTIKGLLEMRNARHRNFRARATRRRITRLLRKRLVGSQRSIYRRCLPIINVKSCQGMTRA